MTATSTSRTRTYSWADPAELARAGAGLTGLELMRKFAAGELPAHGHLGNIYPVLAENGADETDQARHVPVRKEQHDAVHDGVQVIRPKLHQAKVLVAEKGGGGSVGFLLREDIRLDERAEIVDHRVFDDFRDTGIRIDLDFCDVTAVREDGRSPIRHVAHIERAG